MPTTKKSRRYALGAIALLGVLLFSFIVFMAARPTTAKASTAISTSWYNAAPYDMPLANSPPSLSTVMAATGAKAFTLAFVVADGGCTPAWEADAGLDDVSSDTQIQPIINTVRAAGGDVVVSFGGYGGTKLGQDCGSPQATAAAEQTVITKYGLNALDFDLEEPEYENATAINNELGAAQILQQNNPGLYESITIPGTTSGTGYFGEQLLDNAKTLGYTPNNYGIMPFDGGFSGASSQITALQDFNSILMSTFGWSSATAYAHEGISSMNGRTDSAEYFYQSDFQTALSFAESNHLARYTYWSLNRDRECNPPDNNGSLSGTCSSVTQSDWDFTKITVQFAGATPPSTPTPVGSTPTPTPTSTGGSCAGIAAWNSTAVYVANNEVTYAGSLWEAKWWTQGDIPGGAAGVWTLLGSCGTSSTPTPTPTPGTTPTPTPTPGTTPTPTPTSGVTPTPSGSSLVSNGGFEAGSLSGWTCNSGDGVVSSPVHSGSYALSVAPTSATTGECDQTVTVQANHTYTLTAYVDGSYAYLGVLNGSSNWVSSSSYTQLSVTFTTSASQTSLTIYVHGWYSEGTVYVDDVSLS